MTADPAARLAAALAGDGAVSTDFDLDDGAAPACAPAPRPAAVLLGVQPAPEGARMILTRRAARLARHPGQIAFPGGKIDAADADAEAAALREAGEEIALPAGAARVLGTLPAHLTGTGYHVTPVVALIAEGFVPAPCPGEVAEAFAPPLAHVADPARFTVEARHWRGRWRQYYVVPWGPYHIWGATARILHTLAMRLAS